MDKGQMVLVELEAVLLVLTKVVLVVLVVQVVAQGKKEILLEQVMEEMQENMVRQEASKVLQEVKVFVLVAQSVLFGPVIHANFQLVM